MQAPDEIEEVLKDGADRARAIADPILARTKDIMGLLPPKT